MHQIVLSQVVLSQIISKSPPPRKRFCQQGEGVSVLLLQTGEKKKGGQLSVTHISLHTTLSGGDAFLLFSACTCTLVSVVRIVSSLFAAHPLGSVLTTSTPPSVTQRFLQLLFGSQ